MSQHQEIPAETSADDRAGSEVARVNAVSRVEYFGPDAPLALDSGVSLSPFQIAYETYGTLNSDKSNAVLICHALTGDQYAASRHPLTGKSGGWWSKMVGPGLPIDTDRFFVICQNVLGSCMGTTGPKDIDPSTDKPYGLSFPVITIGDMVRAQAMLIDRLGIKDLFCVIGGSMGGMQTLQWAAAYPDRGDEEAPGHAVDSFQRSLAGGCGTGLDIQLYPP